MLCLVRSRLRILASVLLALALAAAGVGCGGSSKKSSSSTGTNDNGLAAKTPAEIVAAAKAAADAASSVHVHGSVFSSGSLVTLNMDLLTGRGGRGRISQNGLSFDVIEVGGNVYIRGSRRFYSHFAGAGAAQLLEGKWLKAPIKGSTLGPLASLTNLRELLDTTLANHGTLARGGTRKVGGQPAIGVRDTTRGGTMYVAASGKPYPLELTKTGGGGSVTFSNWNAPVTLQAPKGAINLSEIGSGP